MLMSKADKAHPMTDIVIVGAGMVGTPLALALAADGWQVELLDAGTGENEQAVRTPGGDLPLGNEAMRLADREALRQRCTALSLGSRRWFAAQGLWSAVADQAAPIRQVHVSHKGYFGTTRLDAADYGADAVGHVVNNDHFNHALLALVRESRISHRTDATVQSVSHHGDHVEVHLQTGSSIRTRLLLAADGVRSVVRESVGIGTTQVDYQQAAILCMLRLAGEHHGVAYERFTDSGPLALLPRNEPYMSVVDCIDTAEQADLNDCDDQAYLDRLQSRFGYRLGRFDAVGPRLVLPLLRIEATAQVAPRTVLLGNAMRLIHPVGGQGYNLAIRDIEALVRLLAEQRGEDPGDPALLQQFVDCRRPDQRRVVRQFDLLARGFRGRASLPGHLRSAALLGLDIVSPLRRHFARSAMGLPG